MSIVDIRTLLNKLDEGKMKDLSIQVEEWIENAYDRYNEDREKVLYAFRKKFGNENESYFHKIWNKKYGHGEQLNSVNESKETYKYDFVKKINGQENKISLRLNRKKDEAGDFIVRYYEDGKFDSNKSYYTDDWEDAVATFEQMKKEDVMEAGFGYEPEPPYQTWQDTEEDSYKEEELAKEHAWDSGLQWLEKNNGSRFISNYIEADDEEEKEGLKEDFMSDLRYEMSLGALSAMSYDLTVSYEYADKLFQHWMRKNGIQTLTQESLEEMWDSEPKKKN